MSMVDVTAASESDGGDDPPPSAVGDAPSTSALVVEVSQLRYALRARTVRSAAAADGEFRAVLRRRDALLRELRRRGLDFPDDRAEPAPVHREPALATPAGSPTDPGAVVGAVDLAVKIEQLEHAVTTRTVIGQAQGILIERHKVTAEGAFALLVGASSVTNRKLYDIATELVDTGALPGRQR